jgi:heme-degrading monooxygenase HmoA
MFARVSFGTIPQNKNDEFTKIQKNSILPAVKNQKGYKGYLVLLNAQTGEGITISIWDSEQVMKATEASGLYKQLVAKVMPVLSGTTTMKQYEVVIKE